MNCAVTGSNGFLGKNLIPRLKERNVVKEFTRKTKLDFNGIDVVYHLACDGNSRDSTENFFKHTSDNLDSFVATLSEAVKSKVKRFVYISSTEVIYQDNVYAVEKATCEKILKLVCEKYGMEYVIIRPSNMYGPYMNLQDKRRNVVANFMRAMKNNEPIVVFGTGENKYFFTYVGSVVDVLCDADHKYTNETITVNDNILLSVKQLHTLLDGMTKTWDWVKEQ